MALYQALVLESPIMPFQKTLIAFVLNRAFLPLSTLVLAFAFLSVGLHPSFSAFIVLA